MPISDECTKNIFNLSLDFLYTFRSEISLTKFTDFCLKNMSRTVIFMAVRLFYFAIVKQIT